jgi:hypothetical protein
MEGGHLTSVSAMEWLNKTLIEAPGRKNSENGLYGEKVTFGAKQDESYRPPLFSYMFIWGEGDMKKRC